MVKQKSKSVTFRLTDDEYQKCINLAIKKSNKENRIIKISEIIREGINNI